MNLSKIHDDRKIGSQTVCKDDTISISSHLPAVRHDEGGFAPVRRMNEIDNFARSLQSFSVNKHCSSVEHSSRSEINCMQSSGARLNFYESDSDKAALPAMNVASNVR